MNMPIEVILPKLSTTMDEGTIVRWLKKEGERVQAGEFLYELETDKAVVEIESPAGGLLSRILLPAGSTAPLGEVVALIVTPEEEAVATRQPEKRVKASPFARRLAQEQGIDLAALQGSGPGGRIVEKDVRAAIEKEEAQPVTAEQPQAPAGEKVVPLSSVRRVIAERMADSARTAARVTLITEGDATRLVEWRTSIVEQRIMIPVPSYIDMVVLLTARALREHPFMNARLEGEAIRLLGPINIGLAVDTERGLLVPVLRDADKKGIADIARESRQLVEKTRAGKATLDDLSGGTFTITNLGMYEIDAFTPLVNLPECAILGLGRIVPKQVVYRDEIAIRHMMGLSLAFDHRLVDGAPAARFLQRVKQLLEEPLLLLLERGGASSPYPNRQSSQG
jgi:pyruvate dehydrogenase E2 component (dihydrolipoamide acetyltransferase)